jgi:hypothetical protein
LDAVRESPHRAIPASSIYRRQLEWGDVGHRAGNQVPRTGNGSVPGVKLSSMSSVAWNQYFLCQNPVRISGVNILISLMREKILKETDDVDCDEDEGADRELGTTCRALMTGLELLGAILKVSARVKVYGILWYVTIRSITVLYFHERMELF